MPRSSDSLSTTTSSRLSSIRCCAARIAMSVAAQLASAARKSQPGDGADAVPPTDEGMSVVISSPLGPATRMRKPLSSVAVATESV
jgi:hypothetical protein